MPWLVTQYFPPFLCAVTVTHVEGCPAMVSLDEDTLMPSTLDKMPDFASAKALSATAGLTRSSRASKGFEPWILTHCCLEDEADEELDPELPELPELPE